MKPSYLEWYADGQADWDSEPRQYWSPLWLLILILAVSLIISLGR